MGYMVSFSLLTAYFSCDNFEFDKFKFTSLFILGKNEKFKFVIPERLSKTEPKGKNDRRDFEIPTFVPLNKAIQEWQNSNVIVFCF